MAIGAKVKGITIEFDGDTSKLGNALKKIDSETKGLDRSLKQVNNALKFNPKNTELVAQKQTLLKQKIDQTKQRLDALRQTQAKLDDDPSVDKTSQEYQELRREIITTESKLQHFEAEMKKLENIKFEQLGQRFQEVGTKMRNVGRNMSMYVTAPIAGLGAVALKTGADFDSAMSQVQAVSGATGKEFDELRAKAREMGAKTKFSATEAAQAFNYMAMAGWKTGDMLDGIEGIMNLAAASGEDLAKTSDIVTDALTAFGLKSKDAGHFADVLAAASSNANTNVGMMGETFKYAAPIAGALGYSVEDTAKAIGLMANAGIKGSQSGTALRRIMTTLSKDFKITSKTLGETTIKVTNADGTMRSFSDIIDETRLAFSDLSESEKTTAAETLVGKNAMSGFLAIMNASPKDIKKLEDALANADGSALSMAETMQDNLGGQLTILKSQLSELAISFADILMPAIRGIVSGLQKFIDKLNSMSEGQKKVVAVIAIIVAAIGPLLVIIGQLSIGIGAIIKLIPALRAGIMSLNATMGIWIAAIAAAIAIGILLYKNWDKVKAFLIKIWTAIKKFAVAIWNGIKNAIVGYVKLVYTITKTIWTTIAKVAKTIWNGIKTAARTVWNGIKTAIITPIQAAKRLLSTLWSGIKKGASAVWNGIKSVASSVWNGIKNAITTPITAAKNAVKKIIDKIKGFFSFKWKLPKIPLPHFKITPAGWKFKDLLKGKIPKLGIDWYAKGGIFNNPSVIGVGEAGSEAVVPLGTFWQKMDAMADSIVNGIIAAGAMGTAGAPVNVTLYAFPNGPQMGSWVVNTYDTYKRRLG